MNFDCKKSHLMGVSLIKKIEIAVKSEYSSGETAKLLKI